MLVKLGAPKTNVWAASDLGELDGCTGCAGRDGLTLVIVLLGRPILQAFELRVFF
jgi:hypothetical protein